MICPGERPARPDAGITGKCVRDGVEHLGDGGGARGRGRAGARDWVPPVREAEAMRALESEGEMGLVHHHEAFFNGSLILRTEDDKLREERHFRQLLSRTTVSWINNCGTAEALVGNFISAVIG